jgi:hypothetical protein
LAEELLGTVYDAYLGTVKGETQDAAVLRKDVAGQVIQLVRHLAGELVHAQRALAVFFSVFFLHLARIFDFVL